jgi:hypothetical protein
VLFTYLYHRSIKKTSSNHNYLIQQREKIKVEQFIKKPTITVEKSEVKRYVDDLDTRKKNALTSFSEKKNSSSVSLNYSVMCRLVVELQHKTFIYDLNSTTKTVTSRGQSRAIPGLWLQIRDGLDTRKKNELTYFSKKKNV